jgi:hypothetical protein
MYSLGLLRRRDDSASCCSFNFATILAATESKASCSGAGDGHHFWQRSGEPYALLLRAVAVGSAVGEGWLSFWSKEISKRNLQSADMKTRNIGAMDQEFGARNRSEEEFRAGRGFGAGGSSKTMTSAYNGAGVVSSSENDGHELVVSRDNGLTFSLLHILQNPTWRCMRQCMRRLTCSNVSALNPFLQSKPTCQPKTPVC